MPPPFRISHPFGTQSFFRARPSSNSAVLRALRSHRPTRIQFSKVSTTAAQQGPAPRASFLKRTFTFTGRAVLLTGLGFIMTVAPAYETIKAVVSPPTSAETLRMFQAEDAEAQAIEDHINSHHVVSELRARCGPAGPLTESRPHLKIPEPHRTRTLTAGTLTGPGRMAVPPFDWTDKDGRSYVQIAHLGQDLCGHPGIVHGGFLATMLDEGLARCCMPAVPHNVAMTANLNVNYRAPTPANTYVVLRATTTKVEGRKAWVEGRIETLVGEGETPVVLADATALFISPRQAATMKSIYPLS